MAQAIINGLVKNGFPAEKLFATVKTDQKRPKLEEKLGIKTFANNEELIDHCDYVVIGVKPQDIYEVIEPISSTFLESHTVVSMAAGISISQLKSLLPQVKNIVRIMPNTAITIGESVIGFSLSSDDENIRDQIQEMFSGLGVVEEAEEGDAFRALTVGCSSGIGFVYELMTYWQDWLVEHGFSSEQAREMTVQTFSGAVNMASENSETPIENLLKKVVSKKGVTERGLTSMRELEIEGLLRMSFGKAMRRDLELGE